MEPKVRDLLWELDLVGARARSTVELRPWGCLVYNPANPGHYDSNKALWREAAEPEAVIDEIVGFYRALGLTPRVRLNDLSQPADAAERLAARGFTCESDTMRVMHWPHRPLPHPAHPSGITVDRAGPMLARRLAEIELAGSPWEGDEWRVNTLRAYLRSDHVRVYVALLEGQPAATATVVYGHGAGLIEDVATHPDFRGRGLATALMGQIQAEAGGDLLLEVVAENAERLYRRAGFHVVGEIGETQCLVPEPQDG